MATTLTTQTSAASATRVARLASVQAIHSSSQRPDQSPDLERTFTAFHNAHRAAMLQRARHLLAAHLDAVDDVVQQTFTEVWRHWAEVVTLPEPRPKAYAMQALKHKVIDYLRSSGSRAAHQVSLDHYLTQNRSAEYSLENTLTEEGQQQPGQTSDDPVYQMARDQEVWAGLSDLLASLPARQRQLAVLHLVEGLDWHEIAERLGQSHDAVKVAGWRMRKRLARMVASGLFSAVEVA